MRRYLTYAYDPTQKEDKDWWCNTIFLTRVRCNNQVGSMIIDPESCTNVAFNKAGQKLKLETYLHLEPYKLAWVNNHLKVAKVFGYIFNWRINRVGPM